MTTTHGLSGLSIRVYVTTYIPVLYSCYDLHFSPYIAQKFNVKHLCVYSCKTNIGDRTSVISSGLVGLYHVLYAK